MTDTIRTDATGVDTYRTDYVDGWKAKAHKICWGSIWAGVAVALVVQLIANLIGAGIGLSVLDAAGNDNPSAGAFSITAGVWFTLSGILASLLGGYAAGHLSGRGRPCVAGWHGLVSWAASTLIVFVLLSSAVGGAIGGAAQAVGGIAKGVGHTVGGAADIGSQLAGPALARQNDPFASIEDQVRQSAGQQDPAAARDAAIAALRASMTGNETQAQQARDRAAQALATAKGIPLDQAQAEVAQYEQQYRVKAEELKQQAIAAAEATRKAAATAALLGAVALLLGAAAAYLGGRSGAVNREIVNRRYETVDTTTGTTRRY